MRKIGTFQHFKNGHVYEVEIVGQHEGTEEPYLAYYNIDHPEQVYFSTVRRFVEFVDRGEGPRARFYPTTREAMIWWNQMRMMLKVHFEQPKTITTLDEYDEGAAKTAKPVEFFKSEEEFKKNFENLRNLVIEQGGELLAAFDDLWAGYHRSFGGKPPSPGAVELMILGLGIAGEAGEVADLLKKVFGHGHPLDLDKLQKEVGDNLWYASRIMRTVGRKLRDAAHGNVEKLKARYPEGFKPEQSLNRKDGDT